MSNETKHVAILDHGPPGEIVEIQRVKPHPIKAIGIHEGVAVRVIIILIVRISQN